MLTDLRRGFASMEFRVAAALGDDPEVLSVIAAWAKRALR
jgi:hypothetical protein